jgi:hypothetical protein
VNNETPEQCKQLDQLEIEIYGLLLLHKIESMCSSKSLSERYEAVRRLSMARSRVEEMKQYSALEYIDRLLIKAKQAP